MKSLSSWLITMFIIMFWILRLIVAITGTLSMDFILKPIDNNIEIILLFVVLALVPFIFKRKIWAAIIYCINISFLLSFYHISHDFFPFVSNGLDCGLGGNPANTFQNKCNGTIRNYHFYHQSKCNRIFYTITSNVVYIFGFMAEWRIFRLSCLCVQYLSAKKVFGGMVGGFLILLSAFLSNENPTGKGASYFSPMSWNTLNQIDIANMTNSPSFSYVMTFYLAGSALLIGIILFVNRKMEVTQNGDDRK